MTPERGMRRLDAAWQLLDPALRRVWLVNFIGLWSAILALAITYAVVRVRLDQAPSMRADLLVMVVAGLLLVIGLGLIPSYGDTAASLSMVASTAAFSLGATWLTPFLAPLAALVLLVPVMVAYGYLSRRLMVAVVAFAVVGTAVIAAGGEWRRPRTDEVATPVAAACLAAFVPFVVVVFAFAVRQSHARLSAQAAELRDSRNRVVAVADAARRSLERDLHDGAQQRLVAMSVAISRASLLSEEQPELRAALAELAEQNLQALRELRELAQGIYPPLLTERGLVVALQAAARRSVLPCTVNADPVPRQPEAVEAAVYFCILEALQNAAKHSGADEVTVWLRSQPRLEFAVVDDGRGFVVGEDGHTGGLLGMDARVRAAGGELRVESEPGRGTTIRGWFAPSRPRAQPPGRAMAAAPPPD